jgi:hypothetical protein
MSELIKLGGLWVNKDKNGKSYLAGKLSANVRILVFKNEYRSAENQPAYVMYLAPVEQPDAARPTAPDEFLDAEFEAPTDMEEPAPAPPARRPAPAPSRSTQPMTTPAPAAQGARPRATGQMAPSSRPTSRPAPPPQDDFNDLEDPFSE